MVNPRFPVYQIDFSAVAAGKRVAATKRRIRWRFGFPNEAALQQGKTGTDCRGEEHEVVIIWSVTSGKRQVLMDGREIHYSSTRANILDHSWSSRGNHVMKVVCHAAPPLSANPGFRQYDFFIDGQSFFGMPKVYELGIRGIGEARAPGRIDQYASGAGGIPSYASPRAAYGGYGVPPPVPTTGMHAPLTAEEEEAELQAAINLSLEESRRHLERGKGDKDTAPDDAAPKPAPAPTIDMISGTDSLFDAPMPSTPAPMPSSSMFSPSDNQSVMSYNSAPTYIAPTPAYGGPAYSSSNQTYAPSSSQAYGAYGAAYGGGGPPQQQAPLQIGYGGPTMAPPAYGAPAPAPTPYGAPYGGGGVPATPYYAGAPPPQQTQASFVGVDATGGGYGAAPQQSGGGDAFTVAGHSWDDPFAPKPPSHSEIANEILSAYGGGGVSSPGSTAPAGGYPNYAAPAPVGGVYGQPLALENGDMSTGMNGASGTPGAITMNGLVRTEEEEPSNPIDAALKKLVNIDHIDEPAEEKIKLTMKRKEEEEKARNKGKSKPIPPAAKNLVGSHATLEQIKSVKPEKVAIEAIMRPPPPTLFNPQAVMAGAMVIHGAPMPPLQAQGFGAGYPAAGAYGGYPPQQYVQPYPPQQQGYPPQQQQPLPHQGYGSPPPLPPQPTYQHGYGYQR